MHGSVFGVWFVLVCICKYLLVNSVDTFGSLFVGGVLAL